MEIIFNNDINWLNIIPKDIKKMIAIYSLDKFIIKNIKDVDKYIHNIFHNNLNCLLYDNIDFWIILWKKFISEDNFRDLDLNWDNLCMDNLKTIRYNFYLILKIYKADITPKELSEIFIIGNNINNNNNNEDINNTNNKGFKTRYVYKGKFINEDLYFPYKIQPKIDDINGKIYCDEFIKYLKFEKMINIINQNKKLISYITNSANTNNKDTNSTNINDIDTNNTHIIDYINNGADVNATDYDLETPLQIAIINENEKIAKLLIEYGANTECLYDIDFINDLIKRRYCDSLKLLILIRNMVYPEQIGIFNDKIKYKTITKNHQGCFETLPILIDAGIDIGYKDNNCDNFAHLIIKYFIKYLNNVESHKRMNREHFDNIIYPDNNSNYYNDNDDQYHRDQNYKYAIVEYYRDYDPMDDYYMDFLKYLLSTITKLKNNSLDFNLQNNDNKTPIDLIYDVYDSHITHKPEDIESVYGKNDNVDCTDMLDRTLIYNKIIKHIEMLHQNTTI